MPSITPLSRTASVTSSVMSRTARPPLVRSCRSCWKTFTVAHPPRCGRPRSAGGPIVRVSSSRGKGEPSGAALDGDCSLHVQGSVAVDGAVHLIAAGFRELDLEGGLFAETGVLALGLDAVSLDLEVVRLRTLVRRFEGVGARLRQRDGARLDRKVLEDERDGGPLDARLLPEIGLTGGTTTAATAAPGGEHDEQRHRRQQLPHRARA